MTQEGYLQDLDTSRKTPPIVGGRARSLVRGLAWVAGVLIVAVTWPICFVWSRITRRGRR